MKQKRPKRFVVTAFRTPDPSRPDYMHRQFFTFPGYVDEMTERAARFMFAQKNNCGIEEVAATSAPERLRFRVTKTTGNTNSIHDRNKARAIEYAKWLAARDGLELPNSPKIRFCIYSGQVQWGREEDVYNTRKDGRRGAWQGKCFEAEFTIQIPHWGWTPAEPVEEILESEAA